MSTPAPGAPQPGLLLRLAGPLQSWGEHSHFNDRDTAPFPTRSGVIGLLASALGRRRDQPVDDLARLSMTVRTDRSGIPLRDLHTVGGGLPPKATVTTAEGKKRSGDTSTLLSHRTYLADAAFTVSITTTTAEDSALLARCAHALRWPRWPLFLGRRSCPPEGPLLIGETTAPLYHLIRLPLAAPPPISDNHEVVFLCDQPLDHLPLPETVTMTDPEEATHPATEVKDHPLSFRPRHRTYRARPQYQCTLRLPESQYAGLGATYLERLDQYVTTHLNHPEGSRR